MDAQFYLKNIIIQNFATFRNQVISFTPGFNTIIGETGSGKSLVLDALQLILGGRADKKIVRRETEHSLIEAAFICTDPEVKNFLEAEGFPIDGDEVIIKRLIFKTGLTKNYINHLSCTVSFLSTFAKRFVDLVGQFENQKLLGESYQLQILDHYSKLSGILKNYQNSYHDYKSLKKSYEDLLLSKSHREQRLDYLNFQLQEIDSVNPSSQDENDLLKKKISLMSLEKTQKVCFQAKEALEGVDSHLGLMGNLKFLNHLFLKNPDIFSDQLELLAETEDKLHTLQDEIDRKLNLDADPGEIDAILERLDLYQKLKRKFGGSIEVVLQTREDFLKEKSQLESLEFNLEDLAKRLRTSEITLTNLAKKLHTERQKFSKNLSSDLTKKIRLLKMNGATIKLEVEEIQELSESGCTKVSFYAETNPGEGYYKIKDIASGGELSRILLSLRQILSAQDSISIFLFDEIDTGIGGETASCIGKALAEVSQNGQVIAITHLPQIAQFADTLIVINKDIHSTSHESRTESKVREIHGKQVLKEVKAMAQLTQ